MYFPICQELQKGINRMKIIFTDFSIINSISEKYYQYPYGTVRPWMINQKIKQEINGLQINTEHRLEVFEKTERSRYMK